MSSDKYEYRSTHDFIRWDDYAGDIKGGAFSQVPHPEVPEGDGWILVGTALGDLYRSKQLIIWSWQRKLQDPGGQL